LHQQLAPTTYTNNCSARCFASSRSTRCSAALHSFQTLPSIASTNNLHQQLAPSTDAGGYRHSLSPATSDSASHVRLRSPTSASHYRDTQAYSLLRLAGHPRWGIFAALPVVLRMLLHMFRCALCCSGFALAPLASPRCPLSFKNMINPFQK
jgi:hypothetical protein